MSTPRPSSSARGLFTALTAAALMLVAAGALTLLRRQASERALAEETEQLAVPTVSVIHPTLEPAENDLVLPGTLQAYTESPIYARTSGYLKKWYRDIGSHVKQGDVLADIDTPEVDQELSQAKATREQVAANLSLAKIASDRWANLRKSNAVSQEDADEKASAYTQLQSSLAAADANVKRLEEMEGFKHVIAPFDGVITRRNIDVGTLINAGNGGTQQALFQLAKMDPIRAYISVPELDAPGIHAGLSAYLVLTQYPGEKFQGRVVRTADAFDPGTRTLLTEVDVPNAQGKLLPGGYAQVHLAVGSAAPRLQVPVNALLFRAEGLRAAVVDANHRVRLRALTIGQDYGTSLEVLQGLSAGDWIVLNPADSLEDGEQVQVSTPPSQPAGAKPAAASAGE